MSVCPIFTIYPPYLFAIIVLLISLRYAKFLLVFYLLVSVQFRKALSLAVTAVYV